MTKHTKSYLIAWTRNDSYLNLKYQKSVTISYDWSIVALVTDRAWCERRINTGHKTLLGNSCLGGVRDFGSDNLLSKFSKTSLSIYAFLSNKDLFFRPLKPLETLFISQVYGQQKAYGAIYLAFKVSNACESLSQHQGDSISGFQTWKYEIECLMQEKKNTQRIPIHC